MPIKPMVELKEDLSGVKEGTERVLIHNASEPAGMNIILRAEGSQLKMAYTLPHFMGYRFDHFNYATKEAGGLVDFDFFRIEDRIVKND